jgi:GT2 family glycosyltransferase
MSREGDRGEDTPELTIIIVNWRTKDFLGNCLRSIAAHPGGLRIQTIVVDNKSGDGSEEMVAREFPSVRLIQSGGNLGFGRANNLGLKEVRAPLVLFLNPDTEVKADSLARMVAFMRSHLEVGAMGCKIRNGPGDIQELGLQIRPSPFSEFVRMLLVSEKTRRRLAGILPFHDSEVSGYVRKLYGACLLVRQSVLEKIGGFDDRFFMYCEDVDMCYRIESAGWKLYYESETEILHLGATASAKAPSAFAVLMTCESCAKLMRKYYGRWGELRYRILAVAAAHMRLVMLGILAAPAWLGWVGNWPRLTGSAKKYWAIIQWAFGWRKAVVAG